MNAVIKGERSWVSQRLTELVVLGLTVALAIAMALAAAAYFGGHSAGGRSTSLPVSRGFGVTQQPVHGNLAGDDGGYVDSAGGHGQLP